MVVDALHSTDSTGTTWVAEARTRWTRIALFLQVLRARCGWMKTMVFFVTHRLGLAVSDNTLCDFSLFPSLPTNPGGAVLLAQAQAKPCTAP